VIGYIFNWHYGLMIDFILIIIPFVLVAIISLCYSALEKRHKKALKDADEVFTNAIQ
jgi:hypothetical protein